MATSGSRDPVETLQLMLNEVLIYTGKAVRASQRPGQGSVGQVQGRLKNKLPDTVNTFHKALDEIDNEIIRAKSVIMRDLRVLQQKRQPASVPEPPQQDLLSHVQPQPVESQSKSPMVIDIDSSSPVGDHHVADIKPIKQQMAPFPDMGMGLPDDNQTDIIVKDEDSPLGPPASTSAPQDSHVPAAVPAPPAPMAPMPPMEDDLMGDSMDLTRDDASAGNSELNFTNMEFTLAPSTNEASNPVTSQEPSFDLTTFAPADGGDDALSLENLLPQNAPEPANADPPAAAAPEPPMDSQTQKIESPAEKHDSTFEDLLSIHGGDDFAGMDMEPTFDDLMVNRDEEWSQVELEHGDFEKNYFGLDNNQYE